QNHERVREQDLPYSCFANPDEAEERRQQNRVNDREDQQGADVRKRRLDGAEPKFQGCCHSCLFANPFHRREHRGFRRGAQRILSFALSISLCPLWLIQVTSYPKFSTDHSKYSPARSVDTSVPRAPVRS